MAINIAPVDGADLSEFRFTVWPDIGIGRNVVSEMVALETVSGLSNTVGATNTLLGSDFLGGMVVARAPDPGMILQAGIFSTEDLSTGKGDDGVVGVARINNPQQGSINFAAGIRSVNPETDITLATGSGDDHVTGIAEGYVNRLGHTTLSLQGIENGDLISLGAGDDAIIGTATGTQRQGGEAQVSATGLGAAWTQLPGSDELASVTGTILTGAGNDVVRGIGSVSGENMTTAAGIMLQTIHTGEGDDEVLGAAHAEILDGGSTYFIVGSERLTLSTGDGADEAVGKAEVVAGDGVTVSDAIGWTVSNVHTGNGRDDIAADVAVTAGDDAMVSDVYGFVDSPVFAMTVDTGEGADRVTARVAVSVGENSAVSSVEAFSDAIITTGGGADLVYGSVSIEGGTGTNIDQNAVLRADVDTGDGDDRIVAKLKLSTEGEGVASTSAAVRLGTDSDDTHSIVMGRGDDALIARATIDAPGSDLVFGVGIIFGAVDMGEGNDQVIAIGASAGTGAESPSLSGSFGIADAEVLLGDGDDYLKARGADGGIRHAFLDGGSGNDEFDIKNGIGTIDGGDGEDVLRLGGKMTDYTFSKLDGELDLITDGTTTDLEVQNVEFFAFNDGIYTADELFGLA